MNSRKAELLVESHKKVCTSYMVNEESEIELSLIVAMRVVSVCDGIFNSTKNCRDACAILEEHV